MEEITPAKRAQSNLIFMLFNVDCCGKMREYAVYVFETKA